MRETDLNMGYCSVAKSCPTLCDPMDCSMPDFPVLHYFLEFAQIHVHWVSDAIQPSHPLSSPSPPTSVFPSIRGFSNESLLPIRWPKYWSFSFSISPSNEYLGLISFRADWFNLLAVHGILKSLIQNHNLKASKALKSLRLLYDPTLTSVHDYWKNHLLFSHSVVSYSFQPHRLQHARLSCPSLSPG